MINWAAMRTYLLPGGAERDSGFRRELERVSHLGLRVTGALAIGVSIFLCAARLIFYIDPASVSMRMFECLIVVLLGLWMLGVAQWKDSRRYGRYIGMGFGILVAAIVLWFSLTLAETEPTADSFIPGEITVILLVGIALQPLRPLQAFFHGISLLAVYIAGGVLMARIHPTYIAFMLMLTLLCTVLSAIIYSQRMNSYFRYQQALKAERDLKEAQRRMMLAENAASLGRLAAALSHELNSPIGALSSGVDTLLLLSGRQSTSPMDPKRFLSLLNDLRKTIHESAERLKGIVARMQRISNLDRSEVQKVQLNELLKDVVGICEANAKGKAKFVVNLGDVPPIVCRPQQLTAVFRNLIHNSLDAVNGDGRIDVASRADGKTIEVVVRDNGKGMRHDELSAVFDPGFRVAQGRVSTGNWNMFSSRQVVREHGGEIEIDSLPGTGTTVRVTFPIEQLTLT